MRLTYLLRPKWELFRTHDLRLRTKPEPVAARRMFKKRLRQARRVHKLRLACFVGIYMSAILAVTTVVLQFAGLGLVSQVLAWIGGLVSSLAVLFVAGVFLCTRVLGYLEVDLYFYSAEGRQEVAPARRVYTGPPSSSYRP